jgi:hypothetical protein
VTKKKTFDSLVSRTVISIGGLFVSWRGVGLRCLVEGRWGIVTWLWRAVAWTRGFIKGSAGAL